MGEVNRSAMVVRPKQPFLEWRRSVDPTSSELTLQELAQEPDVYLIPECESEEDFACSGRHNALALPGATIPAPRIARQRLPRRIFVTRR